jgi:hypothetical protein
MSKLIIEPIQTEVALDTNIPRAFRWRGRRYRVSEIGANWTERGPWWEGQGERTFFRALTDRNSVFDLCFEPTHRRWLLYRLHD